MIALLVACWVTEAEIGPGICIEATNHRPFIVNVDGEIIRGAAGETVEVCAEDGAVIEIYDYVEPPR